jgi:hypothetical protein
MDFCKIGLSHPPECNPPLIGDYNHDSTTLVHGTYSFSCSREQFYLLATCDVLAFGRFTVDYSITVQKDKTNAVKLRQCESFSLVADPYNK